MLRLWKLKCSLRHWYYLKVIPMEKLAKKICRLYPDLRSLRRGTTNYGEIEPLLAYRWMRLRNEFEWTPENIEAIKNVNDKLIAEIKLAVAALQDHLKLDEGKPEGERPDYELHINIYGFKAEHFPLGGKSDTSIENMLTCEFSRYDALGKVQDILCYDALTEGKVERSLWLNDEGKTDNWNDGLNPEATNDLHLCYAFHNLYSNCDFALQDIINIESFGYEIIIQK